MNENSSVHIYMYTMYVYTCHEFNLNSRFFHLCCSLDSGSSASVFQLNPKYNNTQSVYVCI